MISNPVSISFFIHVIFIILILTGLPTFDKYDDEIIKAIEIELVSSTSFEDESEEKNKEKEISEVNTKKYSSTPNIKPSMRSENSSNMDVTDLEEEVTLDAKIDNEEKVDKEPKEVFSVPTDKPKLNKINDKLLTNLDYDENKEETKRVTALLDKFPDNKEVGEVIENQFEKEVPPVKNNSITIGEISNMKRQVEMCWNPPRGVRGASDQKVKVLINLNRDGSIISAIPETRENTINKIAIESAIRAIKQCQPYELPVEKYNAWKEIKFTFDPRNMLGG